MSDGVPGATHQFAGWSSPTTPAPWPAATSGYFGVSLLSAPPGGKDTTRWGTGTSATQIGLLKYAWPSLSTPLALHSTTGYDPVPRRYDLGLRANAAATTDPGNYATTLTFTVIPNV
jgi:hypothetical protein